MQTAQSLAMRFRNIMYRRAVSEIFVEPTCQLRVTWFANVLKSGHSLGVFAGMI